MNGIPRSIVLLQIIKKHLERYFSMPANSRLIRSTELYDFLKRQPDFSRMVESKYAFSRFLRKMHDENILKQVIPNVEVDTSNKCMYQWRFYPPTKTRRRQADPESVKATFHLSKGMFFARGKIYKANNGVMVRSMQEVHILNRLLREEAFDIYYERPLCAASSKKFPDFTILNTATNVVFHWEHFGMLDNPRYCEYMVDKLEWYKRVGYKSIDEGGRLAVTCYENENQFITSVENVIERLKEMS